MQRPAVAQGPGLSEGPRVSQARAVSMNPAVLWPLGEVVAMFGMLLSYVWGWGGSFEGSFSLCVILYFGIGIASHVRAGEGAADLGMRIDNLAPAARDAFLATLAIGLVLTGAGALADSLDFPPLVLWPGTLRDGIIWGLMQQYGLLCVFYRRLSELLPRHRAVAIWTASAVFSLLHVPNPFLTVATLGAGALSCWLYRRGRNLLVLGVMHGVVSFLIVHTLTSVITMGMRVGPGYYRFMSGH